MGGGCKQAGHAEKSGKETGVPSSAVRRSLKGAARTRVLSPWGTLALPNQGCFSPLATHRWQGLRQAGRPPSPGSGTLSPYNSLRGSLLPPSAMGTWLARVSLTFPLAPSWIKAQTGW